jgi:hypothetical protein
MILFMTYKYQINSIEKNMAKTCEKEVQNNAANIIIYFLLPSRCYR